MYVLVTIGIQFFISNFLVFFFTVKLIMLMVIFAGVHRSIYSLLYYRNKFTAGMACCRQRDSDSDCHRSGDF